VEKPAKLAVYQIFVLKNMKPSDAIKLGWIENKSR